MEKILFIFLFILIIISPVKCEDLKKNISNSDTTIITINDNKIFFKSKSLVIDQEANIITLSGKVEVKFEDNVLNCDKLIFDKINNTAFASGNVVLKDIKGNTFYSNDVQLSDSFSSFFISEIYSRLNDGSQFKAKYLDIKESSSSVYKNSKFTPCKCDWNNNDNPIWYFSANSSIHNEKTNTIHHEGVSMYLFSFPILYFPFFTHPDWTVKRRSGFLAPNINFKSGGLNYSQPTFFALSPHNDITFTPRFFPNSEFLADFEYRQLFTGGNLKTRIITGNVKTTNQITKNVIASFIKYNSKIDNDTNLEINFQETSTNSFLRNYNVFDKNILKSSIIVTKIDEDEFAEMNFSKLESLSSNTDVNNAPKLLPSLSYNKYFLIKEAEVYGEVNLNSIILENDQSIDLLRYSASVSGSKFYNTKYGKAFSKGKLLLNMHDITQNPDSKRLGNFNAINTFLSFGLENYYPIHIKNNLTTFQPTIQVVAIHGSDKVDEIPNLDASDYRIDENNLFFPHRTQGNDLIITGGRIDYGLKIFNSTTLFGKLSGFIGQSYNLWGTNERNLQDNNFTDIYNKRSDYLTKLAFQPSSSVNLDWNARLNPETLELNEATSNITQSFDNFSISTSHSTINEGYLSNANGAEILNITLSGEILEDWNFSTFQNYDLHSGNQKLLNGGFELNYSGALQDCLEIRIQYNKHTKTDSSIAPNDEVSIFLNFKYLGEIIDPLNIL